jgi:hypothetical protein
LGARVDQSNPTKIAGQFTPDTKSIMGITPSELSDEAQQGEV